MRVAFFGSSAFSCHVLRELAASQHVLAAVITQPDQPAGRKMQFRQTQVADDALALGLKVHKPQRLRRNRELLDALRTAGVEALAVASYGKIIPPSLLDLTPWPLNVHPSPLPLLRGPSPLRTALLQGRASTEVCIMSMTPRVDDGPVLLRADLSIPLEWNYARLETAAGAFGGKLLVAALDEAQAGTAVLAEQDHSLATHTTVHTREDSWIDWKRSACELADFVRAWDPDIGACTSYATAGGARRLKIWHAEAMPGDGPGDEPGTVALVNRHELLVWTGAGRLRLLEVQPESRARMPVVSFLAGGQLTDRQVLGDGGFA